MGVTLAEFWKKRFCAGEEKTRGVLENSFSHLIILGQAGYTKFEKGCFCAGEEKLGGVLEI